MDGKWELEWKQQTKHIQPTLNIFTFWGRKIGCIDGQIKSKYSECRWYAYINGIRCLHDMINTKNYFYKWQPDMGTTYMLLDFINNISVLMFDLPGIKKITTYYKILFYNIAYWSAMLKFPDRAYEIYINASYEEVLWFNPEKWARRKGIEAGTLDWLIKQEMENDK